TRTCTVETPAPDRACRSGPCAPTHDASPSFTYSSTEAGSTFQCKLDGPGATPGTYASCLAAGKDYTALADGTYTFSVKATDPARSEERRAGTGRSTVGTPAPDTKNL